MIENRQNKKLLLVEDEVITSKKVAAILRRNGYDVVTASSGEIAVSAVEKDIGISLILMDIDLGDGMDGREASLKILQHRELPIIFHTSHSEKEMVDRVRSITRYGYVIKNSGSFVLLSSIEMAYELFETNRRLIHIAHSLEQSEKHFRDLFNTMKNAFALFEIINDNKGNPVDCRFLEVNPSFEKHSGLNTKEIIGKRVRQIIPNIEETWFEIYGTIVLSGEALQFEVYLGPLNRYLDVTAYSPSPGLFAVFFNDITARKHADEKIKESEEQYRTIFHGSPVPIITADSETREILHVNPAACEMLGYCEEEFLSMTILQIHPEESLPYVLADFKKQSLGEIQASRAIPCRHKNGDIKLVQVLAKPAVFNKRKCTMGFFIDITERIEIEMTIHQNENRYKKLLESVSDYVYTVYLSDGKAVKTVHGPGCAAVTGYTEEDFSNDSTLWFNMIYPDDRQKVTEYAENLLTGKEAGHIEHRIIHKDGAIRRIRNTSVPVYDNSHNIISYDSIIVDITEEE